MEIALPIAVPVTARGHFDHFVHVGWTYYDYLGNLTMNVIKSSDSCIGTLLITLIFKSSLPPAIEVVFSSFSV